MKPAPQRSAPDPTKRNVLVEFKMSRQQSGRTPARQKANQIDTALRIPFDRTHEPISINPTASHKTAMRQSREDNLHFLVKAQVSAAEIEKIKAHQEVIDVWSDAEIESSATDNRAWCPGMDSSGGLGGLRHFGTIDQIIDKLQVEELWAGRTGGSPRERRAPVNGRGIVIGVVDGGLYATGRTTSRPPQGTIDSVIGGWAAPGSAPWGTASYGRDNHGNAMARLVQAVAPQCRLLDMRIFTDQETIFPARISNAIQAYQWAIQTYREGYRDATQNIPRGMPQILTNSWCLYRRGWVEDDYARNMDHPFTRTVVEAIETGMIVLFCAGNCGSACPDDRCFAIPRTATNGDTGPKKSIWGANAHPLVMTIGAVTQHGAYVGYSSQGQATVFYGNSGSRVLTVVDKPDFCCYTAFSGGYHEGTSLPNGGTSSSTALVAGVIALLKQAKPDATHDMIKRALTMTSRITWESETSIPVNIGAGVIQPVDALRALSLSRRETSTVI